MPAIPGLRESQRINQGGVGGFQNTEVARASGENLQTLGRVISSISKELQETRKTDTFSRSQWVARSQAEAVRAKNRFLSTRRDAPKEDDGSKLEEDYEQYSTDAKVKYLDSVPDDFRAEAEIAYDTSKITASADILKESEVRRRNNQIYGYEQTTNEIINNIQDDPMGASKYIQTGLDSLNVATSSGLFPAEKLNDNIRGFSKKAAEAQINGFLKIPQNSMDVKFFDSAKKSLEENKTLFTPEEYQKMSSGIETAKYTGIERIIKRERDAEENRIKANRTKQETEIDTAYQQLIENSNDVTKIESIKQNLKDRFKDGKYKYAAPAFFKAFKQSEEMQDAAMSYEIQRDLGTKPTNKQINDMRDRIRYSVANDQIGVEKGEYWLRRLNEFNESNKKDPNHAVKVKSIYSYIKKVHQVSDIENMTDLSGEKQRSVLSAIYQAESLLGKGLSPEYVLSALNKKFGETKEVLGVPGGFPFSNETNRPLDSEQAFDEEEKDIEELRSRGMINKSEYRKRMENMFRLRKGFEGKKTIEEKNLDSFIDELGSIPKPLNNTPIPLRRP